MKEWAKRNYWSPTIGLSCHCRVSPAAALGGDPGADLLFLQPDAVVVIPDVNAFG